MNKREIINAVAEQSGFTQQTVHKCLDSILETILGTLAKGEDVTLYKFGTFYVKDYQQKNSRNSSTDQGIVVEAKECCKVQNNT